jgi:two-component system LytT family response regulator
MALRTVVAEDEPLARQRLRRFVERDPRLVLVGEAESGMAGVDVIDWLALYVVFLDVKVPGGRRVTRRIPRRANQALEGPHP